MSTVLRPAQSIYAALLAVGKALRTWPMFWTMVAGVAALFYVIGADSLSSTTRSVLHGLCAQRPSHSFTVGGELLPFDARMTGIYAGTLWAWGIFAVRRRVLAAGTPSWSVIALLTAAVVAMALDGFNALLVDLQLWHPYEPVNEVRLLTGFGMGVGIASLQVWLLGGTLWKLAHRRPSWDRPAELWWMVPAALATLSFIRLDIGWSYPVIATLLVASAWITVTGLVLVMVLAALRIEARIGSIHRLETPLVVSALAALLIIIGLAQLRFWLERTLGIPQDLDIAAGLTLPTILLSVFEPLP